MSRSLSCIQLNMPLTPLIHVYKSFFVLHMSTTIKFYCHRDMIKLRLTNFSMYNSNFIISCYNSHDKMNKQCTYTWQEQMTSHTITKHITVHTQPIFALKLSDKLSILTRSVIES